MEADDYRFYFLEIQKCIRNISSKADLLLFDGSLKRDDWDAIFEDVLILHVFHIAVFNESSPILKSFIEKPTDHIKDRLSKEERKRYGAFFTPSYIAQYICEKTLGPLIDKILLNNEIEDKIKGISNLKVCDPAMGGGIFLIHAQDFIMEKMLQINNPHTYSIEVMADLSLKTIFGVDINHKAVEFSKLALNLNTAKWKLLTQINE